jgi:hypothetical protein
MLQSVTMPTKNFCPSSLLAPTCSSCYPFLYTTRKRPMSAYMTCTSLNCTDLTHSPILNSSFGMTLNCTFSIPASWITRSLEPPRYSSHIVFIEDTDNMQHKVTCPTPQMYPHNKSCRGPDSPVACAPTYFANARLDPNPVEHYLCSAPLSRYHTSQTTFDRQPLDPYLDALDRHSSISEINIEDMPLDNLGISDILAFSATLDIPAFPAILATSAP